ncbi:unnamed protein product [Heterobilharzia americana]|nr:unnamed protein product [Heterobilharzia americana]
MQSNEKYSSSSQNEIHLPLQRRSLEGKNQPSERLLQKSNTMFSSINENQYISDVTHHSSTSVSVSNQKAVNSVTSNSLSCQTWRCPQCSIEFQLPFIQNTPEIHQNNQQSIRIRTNPWISYPPLDFKNAKMSYTMTSPLSISSSLTDSGIYICTDSGSRCEHITRSTTETEINKNNTLFARVNDPPIIPISPDPPPSPAPKCSDSIIALEYLSQSDISFEENQTVTSSKYSKGTCSGICKSATFDLCNLESNKDISDYKPRKLLTKRMRNHLRNSWLHKITGSTTKLLTSTLFHHIPSSSSSSSSPLSDCELNTNFGEKLSCFTSGETLTPSERHKFSCSNLNTFDLIYTNPDRLLSKAINESETCTAQVSQRSQAMLSSLIEDIDPDIRATFNLSRSLDPIIKSIHEDDLSDTLYEDIQLENLRTSLKILSEAKNVINAQMRNLGQSYINYLKNKYSVGAEMNAQHFDTKKEPSDYTSHK